MNSYSEEYLQLHDELFRAIVRLSQSGIYEARDETGTQILRIFPQEIEDGHLLHTAILLQGEADNRARDLFLTGTALVFEEGSPLVIKEYVTAYIRNARTRAAQIMFSYPEGEDYDLPDLVPGEHEALIEDLIELQVAIANWPPYR